MGGLDDFKEKVQYKLQTEINFSALKPGDCLRIEKGNGAVFEFMVHSFNKGEGLRAICIACDDNYPGLLNGQVIFRSEKASLGQSLTFSLNNRPFTIVNVKTLGIEPEISEEKNDKKSTNVIDARTAAGKKLFRDLLDGAL